MPDSLDAMRLIRWTSGTTVPSALPIHDPEPDPGLFGPDSLTWRLQSEQWLIAAGARAFLMQAAHPKVAQAALDHSRFAEDPFGRVSRTISAMAVLSFGTMGEVTEMARRISQVHQTVTGTFPATAGHESAGAPYRASDPGVLLWVHACFIDSILTAYRCFVGPLTGAECDQYWQESSRYARLLGIHGADLPPNYAALQAYLRDEIEIGDVTVSEAARVIAKSVLFPDVTLARRPLWALVRLITAGQLPPRIRLEYGIPWTHSHAVAFQVVCGVARLARRAFPRLLGTSALVTFAKRRVRGELVQTMPATPTRQAMP